MYGVVVIYLQLQYLFGLLTNSGWQQLFGSKCCTKVASLDESAYQRDSDLLCHALDPPYHAYCS